MASRSALKPAVSLRQNWELFVQFTGRALELRHRGSFLGVLWNVLTPLLRLGLYWYVFGKLFGGHFNVLPDETGIDFALAVFLGLIVFDVLAETLGVSPSLIVSNPNLVKKVVFPLPIIPLSQLGAVWTNALISLGLLFCGILLAGRPIPWVGLAWLPLILIPHIALTAGISLAFSSLGVFFRDIAHIVPFASQVILYASFVFYPVSKLGADGWALAKWNPLLQTIYLARDVLLWDRPMDLVWLAYTFGCGMAVLLIGTWIFRKVQSGFADVL